MNKKIHHKGFSLLETMLYMVIFSIIIVAVMNLGIFLAEESQKNAAKNQLTNEASIIFDTITRTIKSGKTLVPGNSNLEQTWSTIEFTTPESQTLTLTGEQSSQSITLTTDGGTPETLNSNELEIDKFLVSRINSSSTIPIFQITIDFSNQFNQTLTLSSSVNFINE